MSSFETRDTLVSVVCMVAGGAALGEWINIEYKLQQLGEWCKSRIPAGQVSGLCGDGQQLPAVLWGQAIVVSRTVCLHYNTLSPRRYDGVNGVILLLA